MSILNVLAATAALLALLFPHRSVGAELLRSSRTNNATMITDAQNQQRVLNDNPAFIGNQDFVTMEVETVGLNYPWVKETSVPGYSGSAYYRMDGNTIYSGPPVGRTSFFFQVQTWGKYRMVIRSMKVIDQDGGHLGNDYYTRLVDVDGYYNRDVKTFVRGRTATNQWVWETRLEVDHDAGIFEDPKFYLSPGRTYELQISGRAKEFHMDKIVIYNTNRVTWRYATQDKWPESPRVGVSGATEAWTNYAEGHGYGDAVCGDSANALVNGFQCRGGYCDDVRLNCRTGGTSYTDSETYWTHTSVSEETEPLFCADNFFITGVSCEGQYCDNLKLQCTKSAGRTHGDCVWTEWVSEEGTGTLKATDGYLRGIDCRGAYCDDKRFLVCPAIE